jgi:threonine synthase
MHRELLMGAVEPARIPKFVLECLRCGRPHEARFQLRCQGCAGALDARLDLAEATVRAADEPELRYLDFIPVASAAFLDPGISRATACRPAPRLGAAIGVPNLWVKDESAQPTGTVKDRLAAVVLAVFRQFGIKDWVASSTGNSANALARAVARDTDMHARFFCGADFITEHDLPSSPQIDVTVVDGSYAEAGHAAQRHAAERGLVWEGGFFNWARREGLKLGYLESFDAMPTTPDVVVQAVSSGMGMLAAHKAAVEYLRLGRLTAMPRMLMVQQDTCAPMARAWSEGRAELGDQDVIARPAGLAKAILLGDARAGYPYVYRIAEETEGAIVEAGQAELARAQAQLRELEGLTVCHSSAATIAAIARQAALGTITREHTVLAVLTGRARA